jgi:hypothetical protein
MPTGYKDTSGLLSERVRRPLLDWRLGMGSTPLYCNNIQISKRGVSPLSDRLNNGQEGIKSKINKITTFWSTL